MSQEETLNKIEDLKCLVMLLNPSDAEDVQGALSKTNEISVLVDANPELVLNCSEISKGLQDVLAGEAEWDSLVDGIHEHITTIEQALSVKEDFSSDAGVDSSLLEVFLKDQSSFKNDMEALTLQWEDGADADVALKAVKGRLHTVKGEFGALGLSKFSNWVHQIEDVFSQDYASPNWFLKIIDLLQKSFESFGQGDIPSVPEKEFQDLLPNEVKIKLELKILEKEINEEALAIVFIEDLEQAQMDFAKFSHEKLTEGVKTQNLSDDLCDIIHIIGALAYNNDCSEIGDWALEWEKLYKVCVERGFTGEDNLVFWESIPVVLAHIQTFLKTSDFPESHNLGTVYQGIKEQVRVKTTAGDDSSDLDGSLVTKETTIRIDIDKLDVLIDSIGEMVIAQSLVLGLPCMTPFSQNADAKELNELRQKSLGCRKLVQGVQTLSMALRMVPAKPMFVKAKRMIRDLATKLGKNVDVIISGEDTELDRSIIESISDPISHMIRNAMDHGLETPDGRIESGKSTQGTVHLRAYQQSGNIYIEIEDDGRGIDPEIILNKAIEKGLVEEDNEMSDFEIQQLIFHPGFSTAEQVTEISGRGVGMDVVKKNIESIRGTVFAESVLGKGTKFKVTLPLTLAVINGMFIRCQEEQFIIPTLSILKSYLPKENQIEAFNDNRDVFKDKDNIYSLYHLSDLLGYQTPKQGNDAGIVLLVEMGSGERVAIHTNEIIGQDQVVLKNIHGYNQEMQGIVGSTISSDGKAIMILDIHELLRNVQVKEEAK